jgi:hypothetical protein
VQVVKLPMAVPQAAAVGERFYLKPLLSLQDGNGQFYILAISQNLVRLLRAGRESVREVRLDNAPRCLADLKRYIEEQSQLQYHTVSGQQPGSRRTHLFHGHGAGSDEALEKRRLLEYCQMIDSAVVRGSLAIRVGTSAVCGASVVTRSRVRTRATTSAVVGVSAVVRKSP